MERKERELVAGRRNKVTTEAYDQGSRLLPLLSIGYHVRIQNQTTNWDKTVVTAILGERKYEIMMDKSCHLTTRNRRHLRRIPSPETHLEEEEREEEEDKQEPEPPTHTPVQTPVQTLVQTPQPPAAPTAPAPAEAPETSEPRKSTRTHSIPDSLEVTGTGKSYADMKRRCKLKRSSERPFN